MAAIIPSSIRARAMRLTLQDICDIPLTTPNRMLASNGFISAEIEPDVEDGDDLVVRLADGSICVQDLDDPRLKGWSISMTYCRVDPLVTEMLIGGSILTSPTGDVDGYWFPDGTATSAADARRNSKQFELWSINGDRGVCTTDDARGTFVRWIMPRTVAWTLDGPITFEQSGHQTFQFRGYAEANPNFTPALGLDATVAEGAAEADYPPVGTLNDPDLNWSKVSAARNLGGLGYVATATLPTFSAAGAYAA